MVRLSAIIFLLVMIPVFAFAAPAPAPAPERIISTAPHITEILFELGLSSKVRGVTAFCNYPPAAAKKTVIGGKNINTEAVIALRPDLVIYDRSFSPNLSVRASKFGLKTLEIDCSSINNFRKSVKLIAKATKTSPKAELLLSRFDSRLKQLDLKNSRIKKKKTVFFEIWNSPLMTAGKGSFIDEIIKSAGGVNIAAEKVRGFGGINSEFVLRKDPDLILLTTSTVSSLPSSWRNLTSYRTKKVYSCERDLFIRPSFRNAEAAERLHKMLYSPDRS